MKGLQEAMRWTEEAVTATPFGRESRSLILHNLSGIFSSRYESQSSPQDLDHAIRFTKDAIAGEPKYAGYHANLLNSFVKKCKITKQVSDIEDAIQ